MDLYGKYVNQLCKKYVQKNDIVFDCGCGEGNHTIIFRRYSDNVMGGDFENRTDKKLGINFRKITDKNYGQENEFDVVSAFDVIEHVQDDFGFLKELVKITKLGGKIIIGTPNRNRLSNVMKALLGRRVTYPYKIGYHFESGGDIIHLREYTMKDLERLIEKVENLSIVRKDSVFLGIYTRLGAIGLKKIGARYFPNYCNHLFIVLKKE